MKKQNLIKLASAFAVVTMLGFGLHGKAYALGATSAIESVTIGSGKTTVDITMNNSGDMSGTDGNFYLFELQPYEDGIENRTDYLEKVGAGSVTKSYQLNKGSESSRLYNSYVVAVYDGSKYVPVSSQKYITNPEAVAANTTAYKTQASKKGLQIELKMLDDAFDLGVKHASTNIAFNQILGNGIDYNYNGKTYHFNKAVVEDYDKTISAFSGKDMTVTAIILNGYNEAHPELLYPNMPRRDSIFYYMFNASSKEGADTTEAIASFLAERYNGKNPKYGKVSNWIIGNEINNQQWNYVGDMDVRSYTRRYEKAFRIFYNAIKSNSSTDRVFYSLDYNWNNEINNKNKYGGKQIVDNFNSLVLEHGDIDVGILAELDGMGDFETTHLYFEQFFGYVAKDDPLYINKVIHTSDLKGEYLWMLDEGHCFRDQLVKFCQLQGAKQSQKAYSLGSIETFMRMVESGKGMTFIPELAIFQLADSQKELVRPFAIPIPTRDIVVINNKDFVRATVRRLLIEEIQKAVPADMLKLKQVQQRV